MTTRICIAIKSFDKHLLGLPHCTRRVRLPDTRVLYTVLRSPHVDKKSREQFHMITKKQLLVIDTKANELHKKFFWLKRQRIIGAQYEVIFNTKTRLDKGKLQALLDKGSETTPAATQLGGLGGHWIYKREGFAKADFPTSCSYGPLKHEDPYKWQGMILGPEGSPYEGGVFFLSIDLPKDYPTRSPIVKFLTKIYHPNIDEHGNIYVDILEEGQWNPVQTIESLLLTICALLADPTPEDPLFSINEPEFNRMAREWTREHAVP